MIELSALPLPKGLPGPADSSANAAAAGLGAGLAGVFEALLAAQSGMPAAKVPGSAADDGAAILPESGKGLPVALPVLPLLPAAIAGKAVTRPDDADAETDADGDAAAATPVVDPALIGLNFTLPVLDEMPQPGKLAPAPRGAPVALVQVKPPANALPLPPDPAPQVTPQVQAQAASAVLAADSSPMVPQVTLRPARLARLAEAAVSPVTAMATAAARDKAGDPLPVMPVARADATIAALPQPFTAPDASPLTTAPGRPLDRTDFAALVDNIARARDHGAGGAISVSLAHADFGPVSLRFHHDDGGLSVAMASADPGFARAVTAANLPDPSASRTDTGGPRQETQSRAGEGFAQPRGQGPGGQGSRPQDGTGSQLQSRNSARSEAQAEARRSGIFA